MVGLACGAPLALAGQSSNVPRPFPGTNPPPTASGEKPAPPPAAPSTPAAATARPATPAAAAAAPGQDPALAGIPMFPAADYLDSFDAGRGQRIYLYGTSAPFLEVVAYYRTQMKSGGRELFKAPAMQQFDLGKYVEETMVYPPSVVVKDYTWNGATGYLFVSGVQEKRYPTIIQIVPR